MKIISGERKEKLKMIDAKRQKIVFMRINVAGKKLKQVVTFQNKHVTVIKQTIYIGIIKKKKHGL